MTPEALTAGGSEARLRALFDAAPECVKLVEADGVLLEMNAPGLRMIEADGLDAVRGRCILDLVAEPHRAAFAALTARAAAGEPGELEFEVLGLKGGRRWLHTRAVPFRDAATGRPLVLGITRDISEHKRLQRQTTRLSRMYAALSASNEAILRAREPQALFQSVCDAAVKDGGFLGASVMLAGEEGAARVAAVSGPIEAYVRGITVSLDPARPEGRGLAGEAFQSCRGAIANDYFSDPRTAPWHERTRPAGIASAAAYPLVAGGRAVGVLVFYSTEVGAFDAEMAAFLGRIAENASFALDLLEQEAQRRSEERRLALEHSVTRCLADAEDASQALRGALRAICEAEGWQSGRYFHSDEAAGVMRLRESWSSEDEAMRRFNEGSRTVVFRRGEGLVGLVWESGEPLWLADVRADSRAINRRLAGDAGVVGVLVYPVAFAGAILGVLSLTSRAPREPDARLLRAMRVIASQIGQFLKRKESEEGLRESEARFRGLSDLSSDWYWEQDEALRFVATEGRTSERGGISPQVHIGKRRWELPGTEPAGTTWEEHRAVLEARQPFRDLLLRRMGDDGQARYVRVSGIPIFDAQGRFTGYRGVASDVTAQHRGEEELRRFRTAMDMSLDAIYLIDRSTMRFVDVNAAACRGVGYTREQLLAMGPHDLLHQPRAELERAYDELIARGGEGMTTEASYVGAHGRTRWTELHRRALRAGEGWIIVSISRDITERKLAEDRQAAHLRHQERIARFGQLALDKREPGELIEEAVQNVLEGLRAEAVAYVEPGLAPGEVVLRAVVGAAAGDERHAAVRCADDAAILVMLRSGVRTLSADPGLPYAWSRGLGRAAMVPVSGDRALRGALCVMIDRAEGFAAEEINFIEAVASVLSTALQRIESEGRLAYLAQFDPLTGLPNRALLSDRFSQMIVQARRHGSTVGVLFIDLDEFKMVNDTLGHAGGDELLKEVALRLQASVRPGDTVARISGDEFAVVLADLAKPDDASLVAQKIIDRVGQAVSIAGQEVFVTGSVGIALFPGDGADAETLLGAADAAMYRAKQSGRNAYQFFTAEINQRSRARAQLGSELRRALERGEFFLVYQPKFSLAERRASGAEALLRWRHPERGVVSPVEFIPVLEETGLIVSVGEWVLRRACEDLKAWQAAGRTPLPVSVNLSARQFRLPDLDRRLKAIAADAGVAPRLLELEITESQLVQDPDHAIRMMRSLSGEGMRIAIDDFGTGYSSLSYLTRFPVVSLKIDRSFVRDLIEDRSDATIVRTIIEMAHTLGFTVVAEGIETEAQAQYLREHQCEEGQGFLFARPMPAQELAALLPPTAGAGAKAPSSGRRPPPRQAQDSRRAQGRARRSRGS
jgi:diguanylate cyclase (GGDEF)-like protein/PAS domain S-box-containing protein